MDRDWIQLSNRLSVEYENGVKQFISFAKEKLEPGKDMILCPCIKCINCDELTLDEVEDHLIIFGMVKGYTRWTRHGENFESSGDEEDKGYENYYTSDEEDDDFTDVLDMLNDLSKKNLPHDTGSQSGEGDKFASMMENAEAELYPGCKSFSKFSFIVHLLHLKLKNGWSNKSFTDLLSLLKKALPNGDSLPKSYYEAKRSIRDLGHSYERIHVCKNHCVLFWKEHKDAEVCPTCKAPRYKIKEGSGKKVPYKILRYFPLKKRLHRLFISKMTAENMRWHKDERVNDGVLRHPVDSEAWKDFDATHPSFSADSRNVRFGLASDGFDPFENDSSYSIWPVFLVPYNLPPWLCMKEQFQIMSLLIPGPKAPGIDIDVFLQPLIDELKELWEFGTETYDAYSGNRFQLHAAVLWTINDFPAYGDLSGWSTKGKLACPSCNEDASHHYLKNWGSTCYLGHRRFLPDNHYFRKSKAFDGKNEGRSQPKKLSGYDVFEQLKNVEQPIAIRGSLRKGVRLALIKLGLFFRDLTSKTLKLDALDRLQKDIVLTLCKLEKLFPPSFFTIMMHLTIHLTQEVRLGGPVQYRWMYPFEIRMHKLKGYVRNNARPEGSIAEAYIDNECIILLDVFGWC